MQPKFKPGDRVRCIEGFTWLKKDSIYTIVEYSPSFGTYRLEGTDAYWSEKRFVLYYDLKELIEKGDAEAIGQLIISYRDEDHEQTSV